MPPSIRILLVDDSPYFLDAARDFLSYHEAINVVGVAGSGEEALALFRELQPDVVLLDLNLVRGSGLNLIPLFKKELPQTRVIVLTMMEETSYRPAAMQAGADGFVHKTAIAKNLIPTLQALLGRKDLQDKPIQAVRPTAQTARDEQPFLRLAEHLPDLIYRYEFAPKRGFTYVSPSAIQITGYTPEEHYADPDLRFKLVHPDDRHLLEETPEGKPGIGSRLVLRWVHKNGDVFWIEQRNVPVFDGEGNLVAYEGIARDITSQKQAEEALQAGERRFRALIENGSDQVSILSPDGALLYESPSANPPLGYRPGEFLGRNLFELIHPEDRERTRAVFARLVQDPSLHPREQFRMRHSKGDWVWLEAVGTNLLAEPGVQGIIINYHDITERKQAEDSLRESQKRFRALFEQTHDAVFILDLEGRHLDANERAAQMLGYSLEELKKITFKETTAQLEESNQVRARLLQGEQIPPYERLFRKKNGEVFPVEINVDLVRDEAGNPLHMQSVVRDITERKRTEHEIKRRAEEFSALYETARRLTGETDLQKVLEAILDQAVSLLGTTNGTIALYDDERDELVLAAAKNFPARLGDRRKMGEGMAGTVALTRQPLIVDDYSTWEGRNRDLDGAGFNAAIEVPLIYHDELIGTLGVGEQGSARKFTETDARLLSLIGSHAAGAVENARLFQFLQNELNERRQAEKALAESEARYRLLVDQLPAIVYLDDLQESTPITRLVSPRIEDFLGISPEDWMAGGMEIWTESIHPDDLERALKHYFDCIESGADYSQEYRMIARDGRILWVRDTATIQKNERGEPVSMQGVMYDITESKKAEATMRLQSAALETVANAIVITDTEGTIQWVNPAFTQLTGYSLAEVFGKNPRILYSGVQGMEFYKKLWDTILAGRVWRGELVNKRKDGSFYHEEQIITPLADSNGIITHFIAIKQDITQRKQTEERMLRQMGRIAALHEIDQAIASSFDVEFSLNVILSKAIELLKVDAATVLLLNSDTGMLEFAAGTGFRSRALETASVTFGESYAGRAVMERRMVIIPNLADEPGNKFRFGFLKDEGFVSYYGAPLIVKGQAVGVMEVFSRSLAVRDEEWLDFLNTLAGQAAIAADNARLFNASQRELAERRRAEQKLRQSYAELERRIEERTADLRQVNAELERALRVKDEFLANMSHELRTPLNSVIGLSESLAEETAGALNEKQRKYVGTIRESGQHLLDLINDILDLAKIEAGHVTLEYGPVEVSQVCDSSLRMIKELAKKKNLQVALEADGELKTIHADGRRLKQMLVNLLSNAVKFTPENGKIGLQTQGDRENNTARFTVWDTGIGIDEKDMKMLFKPFVQLDSNLARQSAGTGLGLSLVAKMAALHGGGVSVESEPGQGSRFTITLPWRQPVKTGSLPAREVAEPPPPAAEPKNRVILLVDDTEEIIQLFKDYLDHAGYKVSVARNGAEGVALAEEIKPDLILMDIQMPTLDGLEATRRIRKIEALKKTPIIALTALAMKGDRERCMAAGMNDYLSKPVNLKTLMGVVAQHLGDTA